MWEQLKRLDNPTTAKAALEIVREGDTICHDLKEILERWFSDISKLFSGLHEEFENLSYEEQSEQCEYNSNNMNVEIFYDEVAEAIDSSNLRKSYLEIPNKVMKNRNAKLLLHKFFNLCFISGLNTSDCDFSDIIPIPQKDKDARDPLHVQNRCITIACCVAKIYSSILNKRLQKILRSKQYFSSGAKWFQGR